MIAERVLHPPAEQDWAEVEAAARVAPVKAQVAGRAVPLVPHRGDDPDETGLPDGHRKILAIVRGRRWSGAGQDQARRPWMDRHSPKILLQN
ncbi:hypothetical protein GCM10010503_52330 [Streptomyces lucensis JCM 4490]|uniref:Uncharacterized protein n=1 Tax=Streptomyces lucensis JCM 4490 TaxID=1306176 RepID=A0A918JAL8_9ACTN|nr:hypothetical protein [Streptomyces lucensis]GGW68485.1 hypothetical protein GCM10010503_52330 [Streptomyces lucensis JCM 4490]